MDQEVQQITVSNHQPSSHYPLHIRSSKMALKFLIGLALISIVASIQVLPKTSENSLAAADSDKKPLMDKSSVSDKGASEPSSFVDDASFDTKEKTATIDTSEKPREPEQETQSKQSEQQSQSEQQDHPTDFFYFKSSALNNNYQVAGGSRMLGETVPAGEVVNFARGYQKRVPQYNQARPQYEHVPQPSYQPYVHNGLPQYQHQPAHYDFAYQVHDLHTGDIKQQYETRQGDLVQGQYSLVDADGFRRIVDYTSDAHTGFNAVVRREPLVQPSQGINSQPSGYSLAEQNTFGEGLNPETGVGRSYASLESVKNINVL